MAELIRENDRLILKLSTLEKAEGVHGDIEVPLSAVEGVSAVDDIIHEVHGLKMPGSRLPGVFAMGTFLSDREKIFAIIHHQNKRGVKVWLSGEAFDVLLVSSDDPEAMVAAIGY